MAESVSLGKAHVEFTGDFAAFMDGMRHVVKVAVETTTTINLALKTTDKQVERSNRNIIRSYAELNREVRRHLRFITQELVFLQLDIGHIANQIRRMAVVSAAALGGAAAASISFEDAFANVRKTVDASEAEFRQLEQNVRRMSTQTRTSANDLAVIMGVAGQLGIRGVENLTAFTRTIDQLTVATNLTGEQGAQDLARFMNIMQESVGNVDRLGASIVDLGNNFATTEAEILSMATRIAGAGKTVGLTTQEVLALATAMSAVGIRPEMGGSAISRVLIEMANAVEKGGARLWEFARVANMSARKFADAFRSDPIQALQAFINGLERLDRQGENVFAILESVGASEIRVRDTLLRLFQASGLLADAVGRSNRAWEENVALVEEVRKRNQTAASQLRIALNNLIENARVVGDQYNPAIKQAAEFVTALSQAFQTMTPEQRAVVAEFGALSTAILGGIAAALLATKAFITFGTGIMLLARAVAFFLSPWTLAVAAIVAAATAIALKWDEIVKMISESDLGEAAKDAWESFKAVWTSDELTLPEKIIETVKITAMSVSELIDSIVSWWLGQTIELARKTVALLGLDPDNNSLVRFLERIKKWWDDQDIALDEKEIEAAITFARNSVEGAKKKAQEFAAEMGEAWKRAVQEGRFFDPLTVIVETLTEGIRGIRSLLGPIREAVRQWAERAVESIDLSAAFQRGLEQGVDPRQVAFMQSLVDFGRALAELVVEGFKLAFDLIGIVNSAIVGASAILLEPLFEAGAEWAGAMVRGFQEKWNKLTDWFRNTWLGRVLIKLGVISEGPTQIEKMIRDVSDASGAFEDLLVVLAQQESSMRALVESGGPFQLRSAALQDVRERAKLPGPFNTTESLVEAGVAYANLLLKGFEARRTEVEAQMERLGIDAAQAFSIAWVTGLQGFLNLKSLQDEITKVGDTSQTAAQRLEQMARAMEALGIADVRLPGFQHGVILPGFGGGDRIPALLEAGEAVVPARVVRGGIGDIVAWFRRMGVRKMQAGGIAGISTLAEAEAQIGAVSQEMTQFANMLLTGIEQITQSMSAFVFGAAQMIVDVLKALFPDHAETLQKGLDDLKGWWERNFAPKTEEAVASGTQEATEKVGAAPVEPSATLILPEGLRRLLEITDEIARQARIAAVTGEEFDALGTETRLVRQAIKEMADETGRIPEEAQPLIERLRELEQQSEALAIRQAALGSAFDTLQARLGEIDSAFGAIVSAIKIDATTGMIQGFDMASLAAQGVAFALNVLFDVLDTGAREFEQTVARIRSLDPGTDVLGIAQTFKAFEDIEKNRQAAIAEAGRLRALQQQIDVNTAVGTVGGAALGAVIGNAILPGIGGLVGGLLGGLFGGGASRAASTRNYADEIAATEAEIRRLEGLIEGARVELIQALGISADSFASGLQSAFDSVDFATFESKFESSVNEIIRRGMVREFIANVIGPQIEDLAQQVQESILSGSRPDMEQIREIVSGITEDSKPFFDLLDEMGLLAETTERVNREFGALRNVPAGFKIALTRFTVATPASVPTFHDGGVMPYDGLANLRRGEIILTPEQARAGMGDIIVHVNVQGNVYGEVDIKRVAKQAVGEALRQQRMAAYGVT